MHLFNTITRYGFITIFIHWLMAFIMIGMLAVGLYMVELPIGSLKLKLYGWHKAFGLLVLFLAAFRLVWRIVNMTPSLDSLPILERLAARFVHWIFYIIMFAMPLTGWLITSAAGLPASFFGLFTMPNLIEPNEDLRLFFSSIHQFLAYGLIILIILHVSAALKHHFINKDDILRRMIS